MASLRISTEHLPRQLNVAGVDLVLERFELDRVPEAYNLVCNEAGQDVGLDEFGSVDHLYSVIREADSFGISDQHTGMLHTLITIAPSAYSRSDNTALADGGIICDAKVKSLILRSAVQATQSLATDIGYQGLLIEAFRGSTFVPVLGTEGFTVIGCIPNSGKLMNRGWTDSVVLYKDLQPSENKTQKDGNRQNPGLVTKVMRDEDDSCSPAQYNVRKPRLTFLPCRYTLSSGKEVILRYIQQGDIPHVYQMYKKSSEKFEGYATDEFETGEIFQCEVIDRGHAFILEDPDTSTIIAQFSILPSDICRSVDPLNVDCYTMVNENFQMRQVGSDAVRLQSRLALDLGYKAVMGDCLSENFRMLHILKKQGQLVVAHIPKAANGKDGRLEDVLVMYKEIDDKSVHIAKL